MSSHFLSHDKMVYEDEKVKVKNIYCFSGSTTML